MFAQATPSLNSSRYSDTASTFIGVSSQHQPDGRVTMTRDDCQPEEVELHEVHMALTDGALVEVQRPALDDVVKLFEARFAVVTGGIKAEITQLKASTANLHKSGGAVADDN